MRNFITPHSHPSSFDSGCTALDMVKREVELGTGYGTITDHGTLGGCLDWYTLCHQHGIKPILGVEIFFRDDACPILDAAGLIRPLVNERKQEIIKEQSAQEYLKYYHGTVNFLDQEAYLAGVRIHSNAALNKYEKHGSELKPMLDWGDLEELASHNVTMGSSCLIGMVSRHLLAGRPDLAEQYYVRLRTILKPGNFYAELLPHDCSHNWENKVIITLDDNSIVKLQEDRKVLVDGQRIKVKDLMRRQIVPRKFTLDGTFYYSDLTEINKPIVTVELKKGFFKNECTPEAPDGDMQLYCNKFVLALATKYGDPVLVSDDCVAAGTLIRTPSGSIPVEHVIPGQTVITHTGAPGVVSATRGLFSTKRLLKIETRRGAVTLTEDHRVFARSGSGVCVYGGQRQYKDSFETSSVPRWVKAQNLQPGDFVLCPRPKPIVRFLNGDIDLSRFCHHNNRRFDTVTDRHIERYSPIHKTAVKFSRFIGETEDLAFIVGLFLGDGNAHNHLTTFVLDNGTFKSVAPILTRFAKTYNISFDVVGHKNYKIFRFINSALTQFFRRSFYDANKEKFIPEWVRVWPVRLMSRVVEGAFWADGTNRNGIESDGGVSLSMTSLQVISQIREFLMEQGVYSSLAYRKTTGSTKPLYTISPTQDLYTVCRLWKGDGAPKKKRHLFVDVFGFWFRLQKVTEVNLKIPVYDLQVETDESFSTDVFVVHNCHFAHPDDKLAQDVRLNSDGKENFKFWATYNRLSSQDVVPYFTDKMGISVQQIESWIDNSYRWARRFDDFKLQCDLQLPRKAYVQYGTPLAHTMSLIQKHGRFNPADPQMRERLTREIKMLTENGTIDLLPYFFPLEEIVDAYQQNGLLVGPGRGSSAGMLLTYLLGITHVNPLKYNLSMERFITEDRIQAGTLPDIDQDLEDREFLVGTDGRSGWLFQRFGQDHVAQIATHTNLRLKSSIRDVHRARGTLTPEVEQLCKRLPNPPQGIDDYDWIFGKTDDDGQISSEVPGILDNPALMAYTTKYPQEWVAVQKLLGIPRQRGKHACAFVISDKPIGEFIPMARIGQTPCTEYTAKSVEKAGGVKTDFLVVNSLKDIRHCLDLIRQRHPVDATSNVPRVRQLPYQGKIHDIWDLPCDADVMNDICSGRTETVFQFNTDAAMQYLKLFRDIDGSPLIRSITDMAAFTALDRPGPLDYEIAAGHNMLHEFVARKKGASGTTSAAHSQYLMDTLPETHGILVFQEQLQKVVQDVGGFSPLEANDFRICVGKKKKVELVGMRSKFIDHAAQRLGTDEATKIFDMMVTFGQYGFNASHAVCYSVIAYACSFLKHHYPLEWWCSVLTNASKGEIYEKFWKYCRHLILPPDINKSKAVFCIEGDLLRSPIDLMDGIGPAILGELVKCSPYQDMQDLLTRVNRRVITRRVLDKLLVGGVIDSLFGPEHNTLELKHDAYQQARLAVLKDKPEPLPAHLTNMLGLQRFCVRKSIVPTYKCGSSADEKPFMIMFLTFAPEPAMVANYGLKIGSNEYGRFLEIDCGHKRVYKLVGPQELDRLIEDTDSVVKIAAPVYVVDENRFSFAQGNREALKLTVDCDGVISQFVMWPRGSGDQLAWDFNRKLKGSVAVICLSRWQAGRDLAIDQIKWVCGPPLDAGGGKE